MVCLTKNIKTIDDFIKTILFSTKQDNKENISMMVSNRNKIKLHIKENKLLILDMLFKSIDNKEDIFSENVFVIHDIAKIDEKNMYEMILKHRQRMTNDLDILFFDAFSIVNHHLFIHNIFIDFQNLYSNSGYLMFYYMLDDPRTTDEYVKFILSKTNKQLPECISKDQIDIVQIEKETRFPKESYRKINKEYSANDDLIYDLYQTKFITKENDNNNLNPGEPTKFSYYDRPNTNDIRIFNTQTPFDSISLDEGKEIGILKNYGDAFTVEHRFRFTEIYSYKQIYVVIETKYLPSTRLFEKNIKIRETTQGENYQLRIPHTEVTTKYTYIVEKNDKIPLDENYLQAKQTEKNT